MPWTPKQNKLWRAAEHNPAIAKKVGISQQKAGEMAHEGIMKRPMNPVMHTHHPMESEMKAHAMKTPGHATGDSRGSSIEPVTHKGKKQPFQARNPNKLHAMFGPGESHVSGFAKGGGREHPTGGLSYLKGGSDAPLHAHPDHFGDREGHDGHETGEYRSNDEKSAKMEGNEVGREGMKNNLGSKRKTGYGEPQGGTTSLPANPSITSKSYEHSQGNKMPEGGMVKDKGMDDGPRQNLADDNRGTHAFPPSEYSGGRKVPQEMKERIAKSLLRRR